jgi:hypothetical protein
LIQFPRFGGAQCAQTSASQNVGVRKHNDKAWTPRSEEAINAEAQKFSRLAGKRLFAPALMLRAFRVTGIAAMRLIQDLVGRWFHDPTHAGSCEPFCGMNGTPPWMLISANENE